MFQIEMTLNGLVDQNGQTWEAKIFEFIEDFPLRMSPKPGMSRETVERLQRLHRFTEQIESLRPRYEAALQTLKFTTTGLIVNSQQDPDLIMRLCLLMRPFHLTKEKVNIDKILWIPEFSGCGNYDAWCISQSRRWTNAANGILATVRLGDNAMTAQTIIDSWFNCDIFHDNARVKIPLDDLIELYGSRRAAEGAFLLSLLTRARVVWDIIHSYRPVIGIDFEPSERVLPNIIARDHLKEYMPLLPLFREHIFDR